MEAEERAFVISAVKELLKEVRDGKVHFLKDKVPQTIAEVAAVRCDDAGDPITRPSVHWSGY